MAYTTIDNPELYFQTKIYTGDGNDDRNIVFDVTDTSLQPNMLWSSRRDSGDNKSIYDSVRGNGKELRTAGTSLELDRSDNIQALNSNGFQVGTDGQVNASGGTYVSWAWKESADAGFDIVGYTGNGSNRTISHSLSAVPSVMIIKGRSFSDGWCTYHKTHGNPIIGALDADVADRYSSKWSVFFNSTAPTSSVFSLGTDTAVNNNSETHIAYLWSEKQGYSKFGKYIGNGSADGTYIHLGFRPAWGIFKRTDNTADWYMYDNKRNTYNVLDDRLEANNSDAEAADGGDGNTVDFLSNGFKLRGSGGSMNDGTFIYMAFAEAPFVNSKGVPANAR